MLVCLCDVWVIELVFVLVFVVVLLLINSVASCRRFENVARALYILMFWYGN